MNRDSLIVGDLVLEVGAASINKQSEGICGDFWCQTGTDDQQILVLSDGMGSGVKANILATLTAKMLSSMLAGSIPIDECVMTVSETLPMCKERKLAYATFTALKLQGLTAYLVRYDNPPSLLIRHGKPSRFPYSVHFVGEKEIHESTLSLEEGDVLLLMSDGITQAGRGKTCDGWPSEDIAALAAQYDTAEMSPQRLAALILRAAQSLNLDEADDDATIVVIKVRRRYAANLMIGPPKNRADDEATMRLFFSKTGAHVVCGGTTAKTVAAYLGKEVFSREDTATEEVPAMSRIDGVDLVTEGLLTLRATLDLVRQYRKDCMMTLTLDNPKDGASCLAELLLERATDVNIFFGTSVNTSNMTQDMSFQSKLGLAKDLEKELTELGKNVKISMC